MAHRPHLDDALDGLEAFFDDVLVAVELHKFRCGLWQLGVTEQQDKSKQILEQFIEQFTTSPYLPLAKAQLEDLNS